MFCKQTADLHLCCYLPGTSPSASKHYIGCPEPLLKYFCRGRRFRGYLLPQPGVCLIKFGKLTWKKYGVCCRECMLNSMMYFWNTSLHLQIEFQMLWLFLYILLLKNFTIFIGHQFFTLQLTFFENMRKNLPIVIIMATFGTKNVHSALVRWNYKIDIFLLWPLSQELGYLIGSLILQHI